MVELFPDFSGSTIMEVVNYYFLLLFWFLFVLEFVH